MGFLARLFGRMEKKANIVMCGLDNAGKTSILNYLKKGEIDSTIATMGINHEKFKLGRLNLSVMDLGGQFAFRQFWPTYVKQADILIFVIDAHDIKRLSLAKEIFFNTIQHSKNNDVPILILATKQDLPNTCSLAHLIKYFQLTSILNKSIHIQKTSAKTGLGIVEAFQWIYDQVMEKQSRQKRTSIPSIASPRPI
ncbi:MAG: Arf family protein [Asgard group archaeon]|nr:Arf family protein [Asgard group archaeon]